MSQNQLVPTWMTANGTAINGTSMAGDVTGDPVLVEFEDNIGIQVKWTGTPTGTFDVQVSMDPTNLGWQSVPFSPSPTQPSGSAGSDWFQVNQSPAGYVRLVYTHASGSGALYAKIALKSV